jgi:hypothetical protein
MLGSLKLIAGPLVIVIAVTQWHKGKRRLLLAKLARMFLAEKGILPPQ